MSLLRGLVSVSLIAGCSIGSTGGGEGELLGTFGAGGKSDGTDVYEVLYDPYSGETIYRAIDLSDAADAYIYAEQIVAEIEPGIYQYSSTFPGEGSSFFAFVDPEYDGVADAVALDVLPLDANVDVTLAQLDTLYGDSLGGAADEGKADSVGVSSCGWHMLRLGGLLGGAAGSCWWSLAGGPGAATLVCGITGAGALYEFFTGTCAPPSTSTGSTSGGSPSGPTSGGSVTQPAPRPFTFNAPPAPPRPEVRRPTNPRDGVTASRDGSVRQGTPMPYRCRPNPRTGTCDRVSP